MARTTTGASAAGSSTAGSSTADSSAAQANLAAAAAVARAISPLLNMIKENAEANAKLFVELKEDMSMLHTEAKEAKESRTPTGVPLVVEEDDVDVGAQAITGWGGPA